MIDGVRVIPLRRFDDERGWFMELYRESWLDGERGRQANISFSQQGVIRGLHYHERGQSDLFVCLEGTARVVVLDPESGATFTQDIGERDPAAVLIDGRLAHGYEALTDILFYYQVTREYDAADPDEQNIPWDDPRVRDLWSTKSPILSARDASS